MKLPVIKNPGDGHRHPPPFPWQILLFSSSLAQDKDGVCRITVFNFEPPFSSRLFGE